MKTTIPGYSIEDVLLYDSFNTIIFRGIREKDNIPVIIKLFKEQHPSPDKIANFRQEYEITKSIDSPYIVKAYAMEKFQNNYAIILEQVKLNSLAHILSKKKKFELKEFLELAIPITEALGEIHRYNVIHNDINPSNLLCDVVKKEIKIIDFSIAASLPKAWAPMIRPNLLQGTLAYLSPEQTGRMNRGTDYRTDFYSLGVTFYQMLTGQIPFQSDDLMELIHCHIAVMPKTPHEIDPTLPEIVSSIVMKLLAKQAEDRYQNANGLLKDLRYCLDQFTETGKIIPFLLGTQDIFNHFQIPEKLYGRAKEIEILMNTYERVMQGKVELMLVAGYSGIGKTTLVHEVYKPIIKKRGHFVSGKFEQLKHNIPYAAFTQAFSELVRQILTESDDKIEGFRKGILDAVGGKGQLIIDIIPNLVLIIGEQSPVTELGPIESLNRLSNVFQNFITALTGNEYPLTIFLDDLQWADLPSLKMLETLLTSFNCHYLFIIGAYRNNEVSSSHPLMTTIDNLKQRNIICKSIILGPLELMYVEELLADTLHQDQEAVIPLAKICYEKTGGNPFFLMQLLQSLYKQQLIEFDSLKNQWKWHLDKIQEKGITDNIVDLLVDKIRQLSISTQNVLQLAACIGNRFDVDILSSICSKGFEETFAALLEIMKEGFIIRRGDIYHTPSYQFAHDRIQQAAYSMVEEEKRKIIHINISRLLLQNISEAKLNEEIFNIVNHFNIGIDPIIPEIINPQEKKKMAEINLRAAKMAKSAAAYSPALRYAEYSLKCIDESAWDSDYDLIFAAYQEATENACLSLKIDLMEKYAAIALNHAKTILEKVEISHIKIFYYNTQGEFKIALKIALDMLSQLGVRLPVHPTKMNILFARMKLKFLLIGKKIPQLIDLPEMSDPNKHAISSLFNMLYSITYQYIPDLFILICYKSIILLIQYGNSKYSAQSYSSYGVVCCSLDEIDEGYQFGELGIQLIEKNKIEESKTRIFFINYTFIKPWKCSIKQILPNLLENFESGFNKGDIDADFSLLFYYLYSFCSGHPLKSLLTKLEIHRIQISNLQDVNTYDCLSIFNQVILNLIETREKPGLLVGTKYDELKSMPNYIKENSKKNIMFVYFFKLIIFYLFENYSSSVECLKYCDLYEDGLASTFLLPTYNFYKSLVLLKVYDSSTVQEKKNIEKIVKANQKKMKNLSEFAPSNHAQKYLLVEAEWTNKVLGQKEKAAELYNKAIKLANQNEFLNDEALANELLAKFYLSQDNEKIATVYLEDARYCYLLWGADAKVEQLAQNYPRLLKIREQPNFLTSLKPTSIPSISGKTSSAALDIGTIQKCSQSISSTIVLTDLLKKLINIVMENAGAQKCFLLLGKEGKYVIEAQGGVNEEAKVLQAIAVTADILPISIVNYVIRTKESIVLDEALRSDKFATDPYIVQKQSKSILCIPLLNQGILTGVLYLENNLLERAFTRDRIDLLNLLSSQIAISIDNARLYAGTVQLNENLILLNKSYERFVPKDFLSLLNRKSIVDVSLGDHAEKNMTVLFTDIRNFSMQSEQMTPEENFFFINSFLNVIAPIIRKHNGFIDKYIGDAIMALYPQSADDAIRCALEMQQALTDYNSKQRDKEPITIGIGINTGLLMLGTVGEKYRLAATVISDAVNIASRVESLTKFYGELILITEDTYINLQNPEEYNIQKVGNSTIKGKFKKITIYKVIAPKKEPPLP